MKQKRLIPIQRLKSRNFGEVGMTFGGSHLKNSHAKSERPFSPRAAIHTVLRARAPFTLLKRGRRTKIEALVAKLAKRHRVHVHRYANAGNHLHLLIECRERKGFTSFLRTLSGSIARFIKLEEGLRDLAVAVSTDPRSTTPTPSTPTSGTANFRMDASLWLQRPWTRILANRGRSFLTTWRYVDLNDIQGSYWGATRTEARRIQIQESGELNWLQKS